ncbi:hypothetical protein [Halomarina pelagica]|uniref:hypothetical protein n=1 Tax=Halomarina pelagica TaxID=2961599 RepID=UPI0020C2E654|nr:hypothetical protein [Halomarina sp. BND7]
MAIAETLPKNWHLEEEGVSYHGFIDQEYPRVVYSYDGGNLLVRINRVQEPNKFGGWGYLVWTAGEHSEELGIVEEFDDAKQLALEFMREYGTD